METEQEKTMRYLRRIPLDDALETYTDIMGDFRTGGVRCRAAINRELDQVGWTLDEILQEIENRILAIEELDKEISAHQQWLEHYRFETPMLRSHQKRITDKITKAPWWKKWFKKGEE